MNESNKSQHTVHAVVKETLSFILIVQVYYSLIHYSLAKEQTSTTMKFKNDTNSEPYKTDIFGLVVNVIMTNYIPELTGDFKTLNNFS